MAIINDLKSRIEKLIIEAGGTITPEVQEKIAALQASLRLLNCSN
jgi:hypothetical protein